MQVKEGNGMISRIVFSEIFLLVMAFIAMSFIIGQSNIVSGQNNYQLSNEDIALTYNPKPISSSNTPVGALGGVAGLAGTGAEDGIKDVPKKGLFSSVFGSEPFGITGTPGYLVSGLTWGATAGAVTYFVANFLGASGDQSKAAALAVGIGTAVGRFSALALGGSAKQVFAGYTLTGTQAGILLGIGTAVIIFALLYKNEKQKIVQFECLPYEAPLGGRECERCNSGVLPCSEYRCRSLGQACELINVGSTDEKCVWINREDVSAPTITPSDNFLTEGYRYTNHQTRPPSLGTRIVKADSTNGCIKPFTPLEFGFTTNEPAKCKIDTNNNASFDSMQFFVGGNSLLVTNHSQRMNLPSPDSIADFAGEEFVIGRDGQYDFYVRCMDANGNENVDLFAFNFCVDPTPDTTPPIIEETSIISGSPVAYGADNVTLGVYLNEPAECRWSIQDKAYEDMENEMSCSTKIYEQNARQLYPCTTTLTGIKDRERNSFYFRCKDQPTKPENERNTNAQSYPFVLIGSQELNILNYAPNETIYGSTEFVAFDLELETSNGVDEGKATCMFSQDGENGNYITMYETNSHLHKQTLSLPEGDYEIFFRCTDLGGNTDTASTSFSIEVDEEAPRVTRIYKEGVDALKFVTNEKAVCTYSLNNCNFNIEEGLPMQVLDVDKRINHFAQWVSGSAYYVKCSDDYGNQPGSNQCTIAVSASSFI